MIAPINQPEPEARKPGALENFLKVMQIAGSLGSMVGTVNNLAIAKPPADSLLNDSIFKALQKGYDNPGLTYQDDLLGPYIGGGAG